MFPTLEINLHFEMDVDVTLVQFSCSIWDLLTELGGAVSTFMFMTMQLININIINININMVGR